jgi:hypothetical protein
MLESIQNPDFGNRIAMKFVLSLAGKAGTAVYLRYTLYTVVYRSSSNNNSNNNNNNNNCQGQRDGVPGGHACAHG